MALGARSRCRLVLDMAGHSRSKNGVASLAYVRPSTSFFVSAKGSKAWMPGIKPGTTTEIVGGNDGRVTHRSRSARLSAEGRRQAARRPAAEPRRQDALPGRLPVR